MPKKTVFFFCYRMLEFKLFVNADILKAVTSYANLIIFVPEDFVETCQDICPLGVQVFPLSHPSFKLGTRSDANWVSRIEAFLRNICSITYANNGGGTMCHSQWVQIRAFLRAKSNLRPLRRLLSFLIVSFAFLGMRSRRVRKFVQGSLARILSNDRHKSFFDKENPSLVVVGSMGLDVDGMVIAEAKKNGVASLVINQSWDRMVTKGYPTVEPDYLIVWNEHMKDEAVRYLDCHPENVFVEGAAPFDFIFKKNDIPSKEDFFKKVGLDPHKTTFLFPLASSFWHEDTLQTLEDLNHQIRFGSGLQQLQFIIRLHPFYWGEPKKRKQVLAKLELFSGLSNVFVDLNEVDVHNHSAFISKNDQTNLLAYYTHCDACMSVGSTVMIEMSCLSKPTLNMLYGNWVTSNESMPIKEYGLHHLVELQKYSTITNCLSFDDLVEKLASFDKELPISSDIENFILREIGPNRGTAGLAAARRIKLLLEEI